jgi:hypothetical protein
LFAGGLSRRELRSLNFFTRAAASSPHVWRVSRGVWGHVIWVQMIALPCSNNSTARYTSLLQRAHDAASTASVLGKSFMILWQDDTEAVVDM